MASRRARTQQAQFQSWQAAQRQMSNNAVRAAGGTVPSPFAFTPWKPPPIPSGYYDPNLDAQRQSASRGLLNTEQDVGTAGRYAQEDFGFESGQIQRGYDRSREANAAGVGQVNEDYARNVELLTRKYGEVARTQAEQQRRYNVAGSGVALLAAAKRAENQGLERRDIDTDHTRALNDLERQDRFAREDFMSASGRAQTLYDRGVGSRGDTLSRARSEDVFYGLDVDAQKLYQAGQAGYQAPTGPANQRRLANGTIVRDIVRGNEVLTVDPSGKVLKRRRRG